MFSPCHAAQDAQENTPRSVMGERRRAVRCSRFAPNPRMIISPMKSPTRSPRVKLQQRSELAIAGMVPLSFERSSRQMGTGTARREAGMNCEQDLSPMAQDRGLPGQLRLTPRNARIKPATTASAPPEMSQIERSVGLPVKKRDTSEPKE